MSSSLQLFQLIQIFFIFMLNGCKFSVLSYLTVLNYLYLLRNCLHWKEVFFVVIVAAVVAAGFLFFFLCNCITKLLNHGVVAWTGSSLSSDSGIWTLGSHLVAMFEEIIGRCSFGGGRKWLVGLESSKPHATPTHCALPDVSSHTPVPSLLLPVLMPPCHEGG